MGRGGWHLRDFFPPSHDRPVLDSWNCPATHLVLSRPPSFSSGPAFTTATIEALRSANIASTSAPRFSLAAGASGSSRFASVLLFLKQFPITTHTASARPFRSRCSRTGGGRVVWVTWHSDRGPPNRQAASITRQREGKQAGSQARCLLAAYSSIIAPAARMRWRRPTQPAGGPPFLQCSLMHHNLCIIISEI